MSAPTLAQVLREVELCDGPSAAHMKVQLRRRIERLYAAPLPAPEPTAEVDPWELLRHTISCRTAWCKTCHAAVAALDAHDAQKAVDPVAALGSYLNANEAGR